MDSNEESQKENMILEQGPNNPDRRFYDQYLAFHEIEEHPDFNKITYLVYDMDDTRNYEHVRVICGGSFGKVFEVKCISSGESMALKTIIKKSRNDDLPHSFLQEILMVNTCKHRNVVKLLNCCQSYDLENNRNFHLVFELCSRDLHSFIFSKTLPIQLGQMKTMVHQIFKGVDFIHQKSIMHRDLKPGNILVSKYGVIKLADFGMSCFFSDPDMYNQVCTLGYRAPELLLACKLYDSKIDIWSMGVVIAEMYCRKFFFCGNSVEDQLMNISETCGAITGLNWPGCECLPTWKLYEFELGNYQERRLSEVLSPYATCVGKKKVLVPSSTIKSSLERYHDDQGVNLVDTMLQLYPMDRPTTAVLLDHPWFKTEPLPGNNIYELIKKLVEAPQVNVVNGNHHADTPKPKEKP